MTVSASLLGHIALGGVVLLLLLLANRTLPARARIPARYVGIALLVGLFFHAMPELGDRALAEGVIKAAIALAAAGALVHEHTCAEKGRPIAEKWKRFAGAVLAIAALLAFWKGFEMPYPRFYHRWEHYHYYMGAKYFREIGYEGLYRCTVIAEDEIGVAESDDPMDVRAGNGRVDLSAEVRRPDKKVRDLGGDNQLHPVTDILLHPEACKGRFSGERWEAYKSDVRFFRLASEAKFWERMQWDKGYNPPPVWTLGGWLFASLSPPGKVFGLPIFGDTLWVQLLAMLDLVYLAGTFAAIGWAFGFRICALSMIFFGTQAWAPSLWTQGAFLRQDWLFWLVLSVCAARRRWFVLSGAALVYASLLRVFPAFTAVGWLVLAAHHLRRKRALPAPFLRLVAGGAIAAAVLVPASMAVAGVDSYRQFYEHTLKLHDDTPGTNRMGLRMLLSQDLPFSVGSLGRGLESGRMMYAHDDQAADPFAGWMEARNERYSRWKPVAYGILAIACAGFFVAMRRVRTLWIAEALSHLFIVIGAQIASYYYASMILLVPLTRARRRMEIPLLGLAALSQGIALAVRYQDDRHWLFSLLCLVFCAWAAGMFARKADFVKGV